MNIDGSNSGCSLPRGALCLFGSFLFFLWLFLTQQQQQQPLINPFCCSCPLEYSLYYTIGDATAYCTRWCFGSGVDQLQFSAKVFTGSNPPGPLALSCIPSYPQQWNSVAGATVISTGDNPHFLYLAEGGDVIDGGGCVYYYPHLSRIAVNAQCPASS